jgi:hypothetical protein
VNLCQPDPTYPYQYQSLFYQSHQKFKINPLLLLFKALLHGQKDCVFFNGHLNVQDSKSTLEHLGWHRTFKSRALWSVRDGKGLIASSNNLHLNLNDCIKFSASFSQMTKHLTNQQYCQLLKKISMQLLVISSGWNGFSGTGRCQGIS